MKEQSKKHKRPKILQTNDPNGLTHPAESLEEFAANRREEQEQLQGDESPNAELPTNSGPRLGHEDRPFEER